MPLTLSLRATVLLLLTLCPTAHGGDGVRAPVVELTVLETDPATDARLHYKEPFYLRFQLRSGAPVRVLAEAYYQGQEVPVATIRERELHLDGGTDATLIFHWPEQPTPVDEIRLVATRVGQRQPATTLSVPVNLVWGSEPARAARPVPQWVSEFEALREREHARDPDYLAYRQRMSKTRTGWIPAGVVGFGLALLVILWALWRRRAIRAKKAS